MQEKHSKHPPALGIFFATEMWERYGFYVVQTLLALYLSMHFEWADKRAYTLVGSFTALTYLSPVIGGWVADQWLGQKRAIVSGAVILSISYLLMSIFVSNKGLTIALAGVAVGTGLLKPNVSSLLGNQYHDNSPNRENGFTIFYMGITTGIILGTTLPSYFKNHFGWSVTFLSASIGLILGVVTFLFGVYQYRITDYVPYRFELKKIIFASSVMAVFWVLSFDILHYPTIADEAFISVVLISAAYIAYCIRQEKMVQAKQTAVISLLCIISVMFWAFYFQIFLSLTLFISRIVEPKLFGISLPPPAYVGIQSLGMIFFGTLLARRKSTLTSPVQQTIRTGNKFVLSMLFTSSAYGLIVLVCNLSSPLALVSPLYIIPAYLIISLSEILLSPVGLSAVTILASREKVSTMMGIFFVSLGIGGYLSGKLAGITAIPFGETSKIMLHLHYTSAFTKLLYILLAATVLSMLLNGLIRYLMRSISVPDK